jgi:uncharacterized membrane protein YkvA (DUF1232 family)
MKKRVVAIQWEAIRRYGQRAGREVMAIAEATFLTFTDKEISYRHKSILLAALVYFLSPIDAIPDFLPGGFADDISVMIAAIIATGQVGRKHLQNCRRKYQVSLPTKEDNLASTHPTTKKP